MVVHTEKHEGIVPRSRHWGKKTGDKGIHPQPSQRKRKTERKKASFRTQEQR